MDIFLIAYSIENNLRICFKTLHEIFPKDLFTHNSIINIYYLFHKPYFKVWSVLLQFIFPSVPWLFMFFGHLRTFWAIKTFQFWQPPKDLRFQFFFNKLSNENLKHIWNPEFWFGNSLQSSCYWGILLLLLLLGGNHPP